MGEKQSAVVLEFKTEGQIQYAQTVKDLNAIMNTASKEYQNIVASMDKEGDSTKKLSAEKKKLQIQMEAAKERTTLLRNEFEAMSKNTNATTAQLDNLYGKLLNSERAEIALEKSIDKVNEELTDEAKIAREASKNLDSLKNEASDLDAEQKNLTSSFKLQNSELNENASESEKAKTAQSQLEKQITLTERVVENLEKQLEQSKRKFGDNSVEVIKMESKLNDAKTTLNKFSKSMTDVGDETDKTSEQLENIGSKLDLNNIMEATEMLSGVSEKILDVAKESFDSAMEIDALVSRYNNNFGLTGEEAEKTKDKIVDLYKTGIVDSYEEATDSLIQTKNQLRNINDQDLSKVTESAIAFSKTFDSDMTESLRGANALMSSYGLSAEESFDLMTVGAQRGLNKTDELGDNLAEYAPQFKQNGYSAKEMFETLEAGLQGGAYNLDKVNDLTKEFGVRISDDTIKNAVTELGGEWQSLYTTMQEGGASNNEIFQAMADKISKVGSEQEKATLVSTIFGSLGEDNAVQVIEAMGGLSSEMENVKGKYDEVNGASEKLKDGSDSQKLTAMWRELLDELRPVGEKLLELAIDILPKVIDGVKSVKDWFDQLSPYAKSIIEFVGIAGGILALLTPIILGIAGIAAAFIALDVAMLPIILTIAAIAAVIAGIIIVWKNWGDISDFVTDKIKSGIEIAKNKISEIKDAVNDTIEKVKATFDGGMKVAEHLVKSAIDKIKGFFDFQWELPKIKMPHFSLKGKFSLKDMTVPSLNVDWRAKGAIFTQPTIFGASGGKLQGAGEAGTEAALPLNEQTLGAIGRGIASTMGQSVQNINIGSLNTNSMNELDRLNRNLQRASNKSTSVLGGFNNA
ncbi:phage tail tape measure protein [Carnobacterium divergens]|uniref:phage tail tape measure protein n=1 Tax=Carnobacterium divergens TaxID=2748 RepID=UPI00288E5536|nr:phage tail tape measure protein [Carnobacterium divergens]MDT2011185.1 phage tail tape measure protein [Carnobacterium divergens]